LIFSRRCSLLFAAAIACAVLILASPASAHQAGVRGVVRDGTCYGPCMTPAPPAPLYAGDNAKVTIFAGDDLRDPLTSMYARDGRFGFHLHRGTYTAQVVVKSEAPNRWSGDTQTFSVRRGEISRVTLTVANLAVVRPESRRAGG
jgi:hypothetical protein